MDTASLFSPSGERLQSFGTFSSGRYFNPAGLAVDEVGNIFVADSVACRIQKFSIQGELLKEVSIGGNTDLYPRGVAFSATTDKVYVTVGSDHILILHSDLKPAGRFGKFGDGEGEFNFPRHVACDSTGNVYVADSLNHRIQVFTAEGKFLRRMLSYVEGWGAIVGPYGIAVDSNGFVYISDYLTGRISVFTSSGQFKSCLDITGKNSLRGLAVDNCGVFYICDQNSSSIKLL